MHVPCLGLGGNRLTYASLLLSCGSGEGLYVFCGYSEAEEQKPWKKLRTESIECVKHLRRINGQEKKGEK
jgi:hypothetical protein